MNTIQIPAQNIVSYGKKFSVSATAQHYNPFAYAADGTTEVAIGNTTSHGKVATGWSGTTAGHFDSTLDTATSLGLSAWEKGGNYWRPVNGGRIVKWIDSSGNIKTSVNMMPPAASTCTGSLNESNDPDGSSWLTQDLASHKFTGSGTANFTLSEIAKTFSYREFGNGQAGSGTNTWRDLSYAAHAPSSSPDTVYYMEDGLTGFAGKPYIGGADHMNWNVSDFWHWSFIGTGIGQSSFADAGTLAGSNQWCQNLPYGTHVIKLQMSSGAPWVTTVTIDGRQITTGGNTGMMSLIDLHILQPKNPPIPADACIISDYMLMADPVLHGGGATKVSKGVRRVSSGWDHLYKSNVTPALSIQAPADHPSFKAVSALSSGGNYVEQRLPYFGTDFLVNHYGNRCGTLTENLNSDIGTEASINQTTWSGSRKHTGNVLGHNEMKNYNVNGAGHGNEQYVFSTEIVTPIHTSNHYRQFEDLYLKTLVGGDRNMEQHDLIVSADGKTWDETCRNTSYIDQSAECVYVYVQGGSGFNNISDTTEQPFDIMRGDQLAQDHLPCHNKDWAIARNMFLCLVPGTYRITSECLKSASATHTRIRCRDTKQGWGAQVNKTLHTGGHQAATAAHIHNHIAVVRYFERGDLVCATGQYHADSWNRFKIERVGSKK